MRILIIILILIFIFLIWAVLPAGETELTEIEIVRGQTAREIAFNLQEKGLIKNQWIFNSYIFLIQEQNNLKAGAYYLSPSMSIFDISKIIITGKRTKITIPEGFNIKDISRILNRPDFVEVVNEDFSQDFPFLKEMPENLSLEGYLFPDTYDIVPGTSSKEIVEMMLKNFEQKVLDLEYEKPLFEIITMASLIEKEVRTIKDKEIVSGILWKRLENNMPLQVDATIAYITGRRTTRISIEETRIDSAYNTYLNRGLPIGPIANPGIESIKAAINPQETDYWYYLSKPDGETVFSRNFQEHVKAKNKYLTD